PPLLRSAARASSREALVPGTPLWPGSLSAVSRLGAPTCLLLRGPYAMKDTAILYPLFALALWTGLVLLLIPIVRIRSAARGEVRGHDFKYGESAAVPPNVSIPNRNYMNLLELPMLFYVVCLLLYVSGAATAHSIALAWVYLVLRILHSGIHLTYNKVL